MNFEIKTVLNENMFIFTKTYVHNIAGKIIRQTNRNMQAR